MKPILWIAPVALVLAGCSREPAPSATGPRATVQLRDGSRLTGQLLASSPRQVVISGDDNATRTLDMKEVKSIEYDTAPAVEEPAVQHQPDTGRRWPESPSSKPKAPAKPAPAVEPFHTNHEHPEEAAVTTRTNTVGTGTEITVRTEEMVDSAKAVEGQTFAAEVARDVLDADGDLVIPRGANALIVIKSSAKGGRFRGASDLVLDLKSVSIGGRQYLLDTADLAEKGRSGVGGNKRTAEFGGGGAALGAIIGAIAGGGKGAAIGAGAGAGAGVLTQILTKGGSIKVPAESLLTFRLEKPLRVVASR